MGFLQQIFCSHYQKLYEDLMNFRQSQPIEFPTVDMCIDFLVYDRTNWRQYIKETYDCDDFSRCLQRVGLEHGWIINCQVNDANSHMYNTVIIDNRVWDIEPQTDGIELRCKLDRTMHKIPEFGNPECGIVI